MKFTMTLNLGSDALLTSEALNDVLRSVGDRIDQQGYVEHVREEGGTDVFTRGILDLNGNTVGSWTLQNDDEGCEWIIQIGREEDADGYAYEADTECGLSRDRSEARTYKTYKQACREATYYTFGRAVKK